MEYNSISQLVASSEYRENIIMTGFLDDERLVNIKSLMHIGVMPGSNWYGAPNKIFEYGAAQMAVVAPDTPTIKDIFQNNNEILLFRQDSEMDLYSKMKYLISDRQEITRFANNLKKKIFNQYSAKKTSDFYASLIRSVV